MKKKLSILSLCLIIIFASTFLVACGQTETEKNWLREGAWNQIYVYKGPGKILSMNWSESNQTGTAAITDTDYSYTIEYIDQYRSDSIYKSSTTGLPSNYNGNAVAFETLDGRLWVRIMWSNTATFLLVRIYD